ncbi:MAG: GNAT family N-acetyltransferase [Rickettsiaceae bacterium]|nr:GNAT family N-acetyltransferase [Rickettsiaceae bacterium]
MNKINQNKSLIIRLLKTSDILVIVDGFVKSNWTVKPAKLFEQYLDEQTKNERVIWVAFFGERFAGYVTLKWQSQYELFKLDNIPEIIDLNVLPYFREHGIATALLDKCEEEAAKKSNIVGIGVGLYPDYGSAQRLYIKRGYIPNGMGATYSYKSVIPGDKYPIDDDLVLWFTKELNNHENNK